MNILLSIIDIFCLIINLTALTILLWKGNKFQYRSLKPIVALFLIICIFHNISSSLEYIADIITLEPYEDYTEILEPLLWGFFVFTFIQERTKEKLQQFDKMTLIVLVLYLCVQFLPSFKSQSRILIKILRLCKPSLM